MLKKSSPTYSPARFQSKSMMDLANTIKVIAEQGPPIPPASSNRPRLGGAGFSRTASNDPRQKTGSRAGQRTTVSPTGGYATYGIAIPQAMKLGGNLTKEAGAALGLMGPVGNIVADALALGSGAAISMADLANKYGAGSASASKFSGPRGAFRGI